MLSVVIPLYNEEALIEKLCDTVVNHLETFTDDFELICVDDGSADNTLGKLLAGREKDQRIKVLSLSKNFGHQAAYTAGLSHAKGEYTVMLDGDLQDPPSLIRE